MKGISKNKDLYHLFMIPFSLCVYLLLCSQLKILIIPYIVKFFKYIGVIKIDVYMIFAVWMFILLILLLIFCYVTKQKEIIKLKTHHLGKGLKTGWYIFLYSAICIAFSYKVEYEYHSIIRIFSGILYYILVSVCEEIVFHGLVLQNLLKHFNSKVSDHRSVSLSIFVSSALFALSHLSNLSAVSKKAVIVQIIGAFVIGTLLGMITIKTESLLSAVILHAINDIASAYAIIILKTGKTAADVINSYGFAELLTMIPFVICIIWMFQKDYKVNTRN